MENQRKLIVGYDLCDDFSQISCFSYKTFEPIPVSPDDKEENSQIPTALCIHHESKLWSYGNEALSLAEAGEGILFDKLLARLKTGEETQIYGQTFQPVDLMEKFLRKTLTLIKNYFPTEPITKLVVTLRETDSRIMEGVYEALYRLGLEKDRAVIMSHAGAYMYYALSQDRALWVNDVGLFDFNEDSLSYYQISINRRAMPMIASMEKKDFTDILSYPMLKQKGINPGYTFENIANTVLFKQIVSTIYFTGIGFEGDWAEEAIRGLCAGRRVFLGQNLYTKGACYAAKELSGDKKLGDIILLNNEMLTSSVWIKVYTDAAVRELLLTEAAVPWYEVDKEIEVIPMGEPELEIITKNIMTREVIRERLHLNPPLIGRPDRMTRLSIRLSFPNRSQANIRVADLGFGDFYPPTNKTWEFTIDI